MHFRSAADLAPMYPRWNDFRVARDRFDPDRVFTNDYLRQVLDP
jgi:FAD/FMN-containing dehydrogenase